MTAMLVSSTPLAVRATLSVSVSVPVPQWTWVDVATVELAAAVARLSPTAPAWHSDTTRGACATVSAP
jgi:hypothetical protein